MTYWKWDEEINEDIDQKKRMASAQKAACTPVSLDRENSTGTFSGSHGSYTTTLEKCTCVDFSRRKLPCKHMYRLAMELGVVDGSVQSDKNKIAIPKSESATLKEIVSIVEPLPESTKQCLLYFLLNHLYRHNGNIGVANGLDDVQCLVDAGILVNVDDDLALLSAHSRNELNALLSQAGISDFKKNMSKNKLIDWCLENVTNIPSVFDREAAVTLNPHFKHAIRKLYNYLEISLQICFSVNYYYSADNEEITYLESYSADDETFALLRENGYVDKSQYPVKY